MKKLIAFVLTFSVLTISVAAWNGNVFSSQKTEEKYIALTFDDGPHPQYTDEILDILKDYNAKGTFFEIGENIEYYPDVTERILREGHEIGNHTYSHKSLQKLDESEIDSELSKVRDILTDKFNYGVKLLRPPCGLYNTAVTDYAEKHGYTTVLWSIDTRDWAHNSVENICDTVFKNVKCGSIILFHDGINDESPTADALRKIIPELINKGYSFVTVSELYKLS